MTKRKSKAPTTKAAAHANPGTSVDAHTPAQRSRKSSGKNTSTTAVAEAPSAAVAKTPPAPPAKARTKSGKLSALDAAAKVLEESGQAMTCQDMIEAMAQKGYWSSPGGRTPAATLY